MAIGIKVVRSDGPGCGFWRGFARYFASILSAILLCIGYLMVAFTERKQALHDMICDTVVVDQWAFTAHPDQQRVELGTVAWVVLGNVFVQQVKPGVRQAKEDTLADTANVDRKS